MEKINIAELLNLYKESKSPLEKSNIWYHILDCIKDISIEHNPDYPSDEGLYWDEDEIINLNNEREAYKRGYIQAINDLIIINDKLHSNNIRSTSVAVFNKECNF